MAENLELEKMIMALYDVGGVKFGNFQLKSGIVAPVYFDLRVVISYPKLMVQVADTLWTTVKNLNLSFETICGVPYTALPIATCISSKEEIPMLIRRKEAKNYGTKKLIEGIFKEGDKCLIIEDVCTSGSSVLNTALALNGVCVNVTDAVVLLDREQGAENLLCEKNITLHSVLKISQVLEVLEKNRKIDSDMVFKVKEFIKCHIFNSPVIKEYSGIMSYGKRSQLCTHPVSKELFKIMEDKQTNLVVSVDMKSTREVLQVLKLIGPHICIVKTHVDILEDFSHDFVTKLMELSVEHRFLIFEDRKFADIGNTVKLQYSGGLYRICDWANIVNAHGVSGTGVISGLKTVGMEKNRACLLIAEMSSEGNLAHGNYTSETVAMAEDHKDFIIGFICQRKVSDDPTMIHMTPGVNLKNGKDSLGQQYLTPEEAIGNRHSDLIIVGRGILKSSDMVKEAIAYKEAGFLAYKAKLN